MGDGFDSRIYFGAGGDSLEDGRLYAFELFGMSLKARLALLTTCESGYGELYKGEGLMGLASAFAYAGCQNTIMSLWKVNDQSSAAIVNQFYSNLEQGAEISAALASSKRQYLDLADEYTSDPRFWATLVLYGNFDEEITVATTRASSMLVASVGLLLLLAGTGYSMFRRRLGT